MDDRLPPCQAWCPDLGAHSETDGPCVWEQNRDLSPFCEAEKDGGLSSLSHFPLMVTNVLTHDNELQYRAGILGTLRWIFRLGDTRYKFAWNL